MKKCSAKTLCKTLADRTMAMGERRGIVQWDFWNLETGKPTRSLIGYKTNWRDKGVIFNFCPWCGGKLGERLFSVERAAMKKSKAKKAKAAEGAK